MPESRPSVAVAAGGDAADSADSADSADAADSAALPLVGLHCKKQGLLDSMDERCSRHLIDLGASVVATFALQNQELRSMINSAFLKQVLKKVLFESVQ